MDEEKLAKLEQDTKERLRALKQAAAAKASSSQLETQELSSSSQHAIHRQKELQEVIEKRKRARELAVPTNDNAVKLKLREYDEPIVLFGEQVPERRERLREIMAKNLNLDQPYEAPRGGDSGSALSLLFLRSAADVRPRVSVMMVATSTPSSS